jgi:uncharacterized membrane protein YphA (DoxX/SURF4 family)
MKYLVLASRLVGGIVFIFSGFVKGIDPVGSQIKFGDYVTAMGLSLPDSLLLTAAIILCAAEFLIGISLITGSFYRAGTIGYLVFMALFTPLTLVLALFNPVSDCGCFGDAIHLTNWETFYKNIVLLVPGIVMYMSAKKYAPVTMLSRSVTIMTVSTLMFSAFMLYAVRYEPVIDFRPYRVGTNIPDAMSFPEGAQHDVYDISLLYEKEGVVKEFTLNNYPANDSSWLFVDQKSVLVKKGYEPPIRDFNITTIDGRDLTNVVLYDRGYTLLFISHKLGKASARDIEKGVVTGFNCVTNGMQFFILTSSIRSEIESFQNGLTFCVADETLLKTIVRSNPGYLLISDGTIIGKWSAAGVPAPEWFSGNISAEIIKESRQRGSAIIIGIFILTSLIIYWGAWQLISNINNKQTRK